MRRRMGAVVDVDRAIHALKHYFEKIVSTIFSTLLEIDFSDIKYFQTYTVIYLLSLLYSTIY